MDWPRHEATITKINGTSAYFSQILMRFNDKEFRLGKVNAYAILIAEITTNLKACPPNILLVACKEIICIRILKTVSAEFQGIYLPEPVAHRIGKQQKAHCFLNRIPKIKSNLTTSLVYICGGLGEVVQKTKRFQAIFLKQ